LISACYDIHCEVAADRTFAKQNANEWGRRDSSIYTDFVPRLPAIRPMTLVRLGEPFSDPDWLFEVKHDGFRALCYIEDGAVKLVSRRGHVYKGFRVLCESIAADLRVKEAILDGEIVCLDQEGHSQFNKLMRHRGEPRFYAFDLLWFNGEDLRSWRLLDRKAALRNIVPTKSERLLLVDHIEGRGEDLFRLACKRDLEGVVAKWKRGAYMQGERTVS
jgi:bifunctional non-homologous end joining protein LigD